MTSFQSTLGEDEGIAEELAASQRSISIAEFFEKNKHMLGFDSGARGLVTAVKEAVDNALDATEEAGIKPDISVEIDDAGDYYRLVVEDNGPGITKEQIPKVFGKLLYGSRFHAREQSRGQQGIGISAAVLYSQLTSGKPAKVTSRTAGHDQAQYFELVIDTDTNEPEIRHEEVLSAADSDLNPTTGTRIELEMEANMRARGQLRDYIKHTAVVNPHARIRLKEPGLDEWQQFDRVEGASLPRETSEIQPHPHGVELGTLIKMLGATDSRTLSGFLQTEFTRVGRKTSTNVLDAFRDRYFGREMAWQAPTDLETDVDARIADAVANKGKEATSRFASEISSVLRERDRTAHHELREIVANVAESVGEETGKSFGDTVQENAVVAAWDALTADLPADLYPLVDEATSTRKDDATVRGLAERIGEKFESADDDRHRATRDAVAEYVDNAAERVAEFEDATVGETARENIVEALWSRMRTVPDDPPSASSVADDRDAASELLEAMRETDIIAPPTDCLSPITSELVEAGLRKEFDAEFYAASTRDAEVHGGDPFVVEAGIAYGGELEDGGAVNLMRFANRVPLVYQRGACATTDVVKRIGWRNYGLSQPGGSGMPQGPAVIMIHVASTNVPFTSESKDAIANVPAIEDEIELAVREAARELKSYINKRKSMQKRQQKQNVLGEILPEMADKLSEVTGKRRPDISGAMARIMNNVSVERELGDGEVTLVVENHSDRNETIEITDIVSREVALNGVGESFEMDGEWYVRWNPDVPAGETVELTYETDDDAEFDISVSGVETQKLTVNA